MQSDILRPLEVDQSRDTQLEDTRREAKSMGTPGQYIIPVLLGSPGLEGEEEGRNDSYLVGWS